MSALVQVMAWWQILERPLAEPMMTLFTEAYMCHQTSMSYMYVMLFVCYLWSYHIYMYHITFPCKGDTSALRHLPTGMWWNNCTNYSEVHQHHAKILAIQLLFGQLFQSNKWRGSVFDWWIPPTKGQYYGKCVHVMTSSWIKINCLCYVSFPGLI